MKKPQKVCVIGLDAALPKSIKKYIDEGVLPTFEQLVKGGVMAENCLVPHPTITPPNWTTIATGAWPGTHGITDYHVHTPGNELSMDGCHQGFNRNDYISENIWEAAEKAGKKSIVFNYPASYPSRLKEGIVVGGNSNAINDWRPEGLPGTEGKFTASADQIFSTILYPKGGIKVEFDEAEDWENVPDGGGEDPMEAETEFPFPSSAYEMEPTTWYFLAQDTDGNGYDKLTFSPTKDYNDAFCTLSPGEWSGKIRTTLKTTSGEEKTVSFHAKLIELSKDAETFRLYTTGLAEEEGFSNPEGVAKEIAEYSKDGDCGLRGGGIRAFRLGWIDLDTYVETNDLQNILFAEAAEYLLTNKEWDIFYMHAHASDWVNHSILTRVDPETEKDQETQKRYEEAERKVYSGLDKMISRILAAAGKGVLTVLISDHGALADGVEPMPGVFNKFVEKGLISVAKEADQPGLMGVLTHQVDWSKTKAVFQRVVHVYVNLKGRDPRGIVEPGEEYEQVRQEIIDTLMTYVDPETGKRPFSLALRREDARPLGCYGDRVGDVIYAVYPEFSGQHGNQLPTAEWSAGSIKGLFIMHGPGIKKGMVVERTVWITDLVPTICYLMDYPVPDHAEGAILYQTFRDFNFKIKDVQKLRDGIARMETALTRQDREPWDKHDCA